MESAIAVNVSWCKPPETGDEFYDAAYQAVRSFVTSLAQRLATIAEAEWSAFVEQAAFLKSMIDEARQRIRKINDWHLCRTLQSEFARLVTALEGRDVTAATKALLA